MNIYGKLLVGNLCVLLGAGLVIAGSGAAATTQGFAQLSDLGRAAGQHGEGHGEAVDHAVAEASWAERSVDVGQEGAVREVGVADHDPEAIMSE